jgi:hypothetical protein
MRLPTRVRRGARSFDLPLFVIPAQAGIHFDFDFAATSQKSKWIPAFAGMTTPKFFKV